MTNVVCSPFQDNMNWEYGHMGWGGEDGSSKFRGVVAERTRRVSCSACCIVGACVAFVFVRVCEIGLSMPLLWLSW